MYDKKSALRTTSVLALGALLITACSTPPKEKALDTIDAPDSWAAVDGEIVNSSGQKLPLNWVSSLSDPKVEELIREAMNNNNDLGAAGARMKIARATTGSVRAGLLPSVSATVDENNVGSNDSSGIAENYQLSTRLSWEADVWARITDSTRASYLDTRAAEADFISARLSIAGRVAQGWYALIEARQQRELAERNVETNEANLRITERRYQRGISTILDVRLARSSLGSSKAALINRQQQEIRAQRTLEILLGRYPSAQMVADAELPDLPPLTSETGEVTGIGSPQQVLDQRPDILAAEARLRAEGLRTSAARKALLPSLSLSGVASYTNTNFSDLFDMDQLVGNLTASITQPIFQGGRLVSQANRAKASQELALYNYAGTVLNAFAEVENTITAETLLAAREEALKLAFEEAVASEELTERQYINGTRSIFNLINAQQRRINAESSYISAKQQRLSNRITLYLALGGTFNVGEEKFGRGTDEGNKSLPLFRRWWLQAEGQPDTEEAAGAES